MISYKQYESDVYIKCLIGCALYLCTIIFLFCLFRVNLNPFSAINITNITFSILYD